METLFLFCIQNFKTKVVLDMPKKPAVASIGL